MPPDNVGWWVLSGAAALSAAGAALLFRILLALLKRGVIDRLDSLVATTEGQFKEVRKEIGELGERVAALESWPGRRRRR